MLQGSARLSTSRKRGRGEEKEMESGDAAQMEGVEGVAPVSAAPVAAAREEGPAVKRVRELDKKIEDYGDEILVETRRLREPNANVEAINMAIKALEAQQAELKAQRDRELGVGAAVPRAPPPPPAARIADLLAKVKFPTRAQTMGLLKPFEPASGTAHASAARKVKTDLVSQRPSLVLDALDRRVKEYGVPLGRLETRGNPYGLVMLGPSGCGKTRKILQYLAKNVGYFVPHKREAEDKSGSEALAAVLDLAVGGAPALDEGATDAGAEPATLFARRQRVAFGVKCVLVAYEAVYEAWLKASGHKEEKEGAAAWLLVQLYPAQVLGEDVFRHVATVLFKEYDGNTLNSSVSPRACFIDEAQAITKRGLYLRSTDTARSSLRTLLSAVIEGVKDAMGVSPILAGTGFSLALEKRTLVSQMAAGDSAEWAYVDFPPLSPAEVKTMLATRLSVAGQRRVDEAAHWLSGRPRFAARFIERVLASGGSVDAELDGYLAGLWSPPPASLTIKATPRTPGEAFYALGLHSPREAVPWRTSEDAASMPSPLPADRSFGGTYDEGVQEAFFLTVGHPPQVRHNTLLSELDIAYVANVVAADRPAETQVKMEPLVLEAATRHIARYTPDFFLRRVYALEGKAGPMDDEFEYVVAFDVLPKWFPLEPAARFEDSVVMRLPRNAGWRRVVPGPEGEGGEPVAVDATAFAALVARFEGPWVPARPSCFGRVAGKGSKGEAYEWLRASLPGWAWPERPPADDPEGMVPSLFFPDPDAGGDIYLALRRPEDARAVMLVIVQVKLTKGTLADGSMDGTGTRDALLTTDPAKIHVHNRGRSGEGAAASPSPASFVAQAVRAVAGSRASRARAAAARGAERPIASVDEERRLFIAALIDVPVVRVLVSGACAVSKAETGLVANGRGGRVSHDLQVVVDSEGLAVDGLLGERVVARLAALKGLE